MRALVNYDWPGNVRELENAIERAVIIASGRQIELDDLPEAISKAAAAAHAYVRHERASAAGEGRPIGIEIELPATMDEVEKQVIDATLDYTDGDKSRASRLLEYRTEDALSEAGAIRGRWEVNAIDQQGTS